MYKYDCIIDDNDYTTIMIVNISVSHECGWMGI